MPHPRSDGILASMKKKQIKKNKPSKQIDQMREVELSDVSFPEDEAGLEQEMESTGNRGKLMFAGIAILLLVVIGLFKFQYLLIPAKVNGKPIYIWQYVSYLHKTFGKDAMQTLTTQALIESEIAKQKITVQSSDIQNEIDLLDKQASASGGLTAMLAAQQMTIDQLRDQIRIQMAVKQILKDKLTVTDEEINDAFTKNKDFFKGVPEAEAKLRIKEQLINQKFQSEAGKWLSELRQNSKVEIAFPGMSAE